MASTTTSTKPFTVTYKVYFFDVVEPVGVDSFSAAGKQWLGYKNLHIIREDRVYQQENLILQILYEYHFAPPGQLEAIL
jgi:hypothetical protein